MRTTTLSAAAYVIAIVSMVSVPAPLQAQPRMLLASIAVVLMCRPGGSLATWWQRRADR